MHLSYFLLLDANMAYDVSSDVLEKFGQCGATFFGSLFEHCTSAPLWIDTSGTKCTINCPLDGLLNLAWGRGGGDSEQTKARKAAERARKRANAEREKRMNRRRMI
jgi:hypothetical protein